MNRVPNGVSLTAAQGGVGSSRSDGGARRVLLLAPQPFYEDRGTPIAVRQVLEALSQLGYRVDVTTFPVGGSPDIPGVRYHRVPNPLGIRSVPIGFSLRKVWLDAFLLAKVRRLLRRRSYGCIHAVEEAAFLALLARRDSTPVIYDMQSSIPEQLARYRLLRRGPFRGALDAWERWVLSRADYVVTSVGLAGHVRARAPGASVREWRYPSSVPSVERSRIEGLRADLGIGEDRPIVLYTGTFEDYQGLPLLLDAIPVVLRRLPRTVFVFVGANGSGELEALRQQAGGIPLSALRLVERQARERIPEYLAMADVAVSPRVRGSNLPLKILEYLAAGCPLIATSIPAHTAILDERVAVLADPSPDSLGAAIVGLLQDPDRASALRSAARQYARENCDWIGFLRSVAALYEGISFER